MPGKSEEWSEVEIRTVIHFLNCAGFSNEEICNRIWEVCGSHSVFREEVHHILTADKHAKVPAAGRVDSPDLSTEDDTDISDFLALSDESTCGYSTHLSKWTNLSGSKNQWNVSKKKLYDRKCSTESQHHPSNLEKTTDLQNCDEFRNEVLYEKLHDMFRNFSPQNFSVSASEIKDLGITTEGNIDKAINIVFEEAVKKPDFSIPYANLCKYLSLLKVPCSSQASHFVDIRELLLTKCEKEFERNEFIHLCKDESRPVKVCETVMEPLQKILDKKQNRRRQLGTARFMGWLFKLDIFTESMIHRIIKNLLHRGDEVNIECVCLLITAIGKELNSDMIENYISDMKSRINKQYVGTQLEDILQQISDLQMNNWVTCVVGKSNKIIDEILSKDHEEKGTKRLEEILRVNQGKMQEHKKMPLQTECGDSLSDDYEQKEVSVLKGAEMSLGDKKKIKIEFGYQRSNFAAAPHQFSMPSSQAPMYHLPSNNWNSYNQTAVFFGQMSKMPSTCPQIPAPIQVQAGPKKTASYKRLPIIDPVTGRDVREDITNEPFSQGAKDGNQSQVTSLTQQHAAQQSTTTVPVVGTFMRHSDLPDSGKVQQNDNYLISGQLQDSPAVLSEETEGKGMKKSPVKAPSKNKIMLKYKVDQWSPLNPEGKKQYDREFLLILQSHPLSMKKSSDLPNLDVIKDRATLHKLNERKNRKSSASQYPPGASYTDTFKMYHGGFKDSTNMGHESKSPSRVTCINTLAKHQVKLNKLKNASVPFCKTESVAEDDQTQNLCKKVRGILNELTPEKFSSLVSKVKQLDITTEESLNGVVDSVFETAIEQPGLSALCAQMCKRLALLKVASRVEGKFVSFKKLMITKCQREFQKEIEKQNREERIKLIQEREADEKRRQLQKDFEQEKNKRKCLGSIRFIGELFKLRMLEEFIIHQCIQKLLNQGDDVSLECLCCLLTSIGKELENEKKTNAVLMESYFSDIKKVVDKKQTCFTVQQMLQDVIDLRMNNWVPCYGEDRLQTTDQIYKEAKREQMFQQIMSPKSISDDCGQKRHQWSQLNPEGKKQYDREFLLNLQSQPMSVKKPSDLPNLDAVKDKATLHKLN